MSMIATVSIKKEELEYLLKLPDVTNIIINNTNSFFRLVRISDIEEYLEKQDKMIINRLYKEYPKKYVLAEFISSINFIINKDRKIELLNNDIEKSLNIIFKLAFNLVLRKCP